MTNEQREAIELAKEFTKMDFSNPMGWTGYYDTDLKELSQAIDIVLSLIKKNQIEKELYKEELDSIYKALDIERGVARPSTSEIIQAMKNTIKSQAKQIDLMAEYWNTGLAMCDNCDKIVEKYERNNCQNCIKQYFERKVKDGG